MKPSFLDKLEEIVKSNLNNEQFGVKELARKVSLSRFQVHRKLQSLTGQSVSRFIREVRLKRAMGLLMDGQGPAADVAYQVGFGSATYFNKCFSAYYGITPGEIKKIESSKLRNVTNAQVDNLDLISNNKKWNLKPTVDIWNELMRRQVLQAGMSYLLVSWLLLQLIEIAGRMSLSPSWLFIAILIILLVGFPLALYLAWHIEKTQEGFVRIKQETSKEKSSSINQRKPFTSTLTHISIFIIIIFSYLVPKKATIYPNPLYSGITRNSQDTGQSIAILPFENYSTNPNNQHFTNGIRDAIIHELSNIQDLRVSPGRTTKQNQGSIKSIPEIAQELGVAYVLQGSIQQYDETFRITTGLIDVKNNEYVWSKEYTEPLKNMFDIMTAIAVDVASALDIIITGKPEEGMKILEDVLAYEQSRSNTWSVAEIYAEMGEYEMAMDKLLELEQINPYHHKFEFFQHYQIFETLYDDPEFLALINRVNMIKTKARNQIREL